MSQEIVFRAVEKRLNQQAAQTGEQLDKMLEQISLQAGKRLEEQRSPDQELERQAAFLHAMVQSEEQKSEAKQAMQAELDKLADAMRKLQQAPETDE